MSTAGSVRSGDKSRYTPPERSGGAHDAAPGARKRVRIFRWQGIIPIAVVLGLVLVGWTVFGDRVIRGTISEAGTKALGTQLDIANLNVRTFATTVELRGIALADPFDRNKNLIEIGRMVMELEPKPLLQKKVVVRRLTIADVQTGTRRATPALPVTGGGFAPRALAEVQRFARQFRVPLLSLVPLDSLKALVLDPTQLKA